MAPTTPRPPAPRGANALSTSTAPVSHATLATPTQDDFPEHDPSLFARPVAVFTSLVEAELARGRLEVQGIAARVEGAHTAVIAPHLTPMSGGIRVLVQQGDLQAAREVIFSPSALDFVSDDVLTAAALAAGPAPEEKDPYAERPAHQLMRDRTVRTMRIALALITAATGAAIAWFSSTR